MGQSRRRVRAGGGRDGNIHVSFGSDANGWNQKGVNSRQTAHVRGYGGKGCLEGWFIYNFS